MSLPLHCLDQRPLTFVGTPRHARCAAHVFPTPHASQALVTLVTRGRFLDVSAKSGLRVTPCERRFARESSFAGTADICAGHGRCMCAATWVVRPSVPLSLSPSLPAMLPLFAWFPVKQRARQAFRRNRDDVACCVHATRRKEKNGFHVGDARWNFLCQPKK